MHTTKNCLILLGRLESGTSRLAAYLTHNTDIYVSNRRAEDGGWGDIKYYAFSGSCVMHWQGSHMVRFLARKCILFRPHDNSALYHNSGYPRTYFLKINFSNLASLHASYLYIYSGHARFYCRMVQIKYYYNCYWIWSCKVWIVG